MHFWHRQTAQVTLSDIKHCHSFHVFKGVMRQSGRKDISISPGSSLPGMENHALLSVTSYKTQDKNVSATIPPLS